MKKSSIVSGNQFQQAKSKMDEVFTELAKHGFFDFSVSGEKIKDKRVEVIISAGKEHKYTIPADELP